MSDQRAELLNRSRPDEPLKFWVRERPPGKRGEAIDHYVVFYGPRSCSYGRLPFKFEHWEVAQAFANSLQANLPDEEQIAEYLL